MQQVLNDLWGAIVNMLIDGSSMVDRMKFGKEIDVVNSFWALIQIIAMGMTIIYFLMELNRAWLYEGREMTVKTFGAPFIKFAIAIGILSVSGKLVSWILQACNALIAQTQLISLGTDGTFNDTSLTIPGVNLFAFLLYFLIMLIFLIIAAVISLVFWYKALTFRLEFVFRLCATPIALADIYSGQNSIAVRWLKGLFAMGLYGAFLVLLPKIGASLITDATMGEFNLLGLLRFAGSVIVIPIAEIGAMSVARQVSKEALGA